MAISKGQRVTISCKSFLADGHPLDDPEDNEPFSIEAGLEEGTAIALILGKAIVGMEFDSTKTIEVGPDEAFGEYEEDRVIAVDREQMPEQLEVGESFETQSPEGETVQGFIAEITDEQVVLDFNHPLAGQTLKIDITVLPEDQQIEDDD